MYVHVYTLCLGHRRLPAAMPAAYSYDESIHNDHCKLRQILNPVGCYDSRPCKDCNCGQQLAMNCCPLPGPT